MRDHAPHPYKTAGKIIVLHILIFKTEMKGGNYTKLKGMKHHQIYPALNFLAYLWFRPICIYLYSQNRGTADVDKVFSGYQPR
jgi:hypothetical protein